MYEDENKNAFGRDDGDVDHKAGFGTARGPDHTGSESEGKSRDSEGGARMSESEIDVDAVREEVSQIKDAMGLNERYPSQFYLWLVYGVLVALAAGASQLIALNRLPAWYHPVAWFGFVGVAGVVQWLRGGEVDAQPAGAKPNIQLQFGGVFAYYVVIIAATSVFPSVGYLTRSAVIFGMTVGLVGVSYVVVGSSLTAYYIRKRDRYTFYAGGLWMFGLAAAIPVVPALRKWGYAAFGVLYLAHSVAAYLLLRE
jgi:hypothetical protein